MPCHPKSGQSFSCSTWNVSRTYFASTPSTETLKRRLRLNEVAPSTGVHLSLSAESFSFDTAILSSPRTAVFSLIKVKRSSGELRSSEIIKVVSPSRSEQLTVLLSRVRMFFSDWLFNAAGVSWPSGAMHSTFIWATFRVSLDVVLTVGAPHTTELVVARIRTIARQGHNIGYCLRA